MKKVKLGSLIEFQRGYDLTHENMKGGPYPVVGSTSTIGFHDEFKVSDGIVIGRSGSVGKPQLIRGPYWPHNTALFSTTIKGNDLDYMYYLVENLGLDRMKTGSNIPTLNRNDLYPITVRAETDPAIQKKLALPLVTIDSMITNNNAIISELESMAKDIYDYWFVQFDFPDENEKPYKSSGGKMVWCEELKREIPEGWDVRSINSLVSTSRGISYSTETITGSSGVPMINLASFNVDASYKPSGLKVFSGSYSKEDVLKPFDLIMCNTQQTDLDPKKDIIGKTMLVPDVFDGDIVSSHHITKLLTDDLSMRVFLNATGKTRWFHKAMSGHCSGTSILGLDVKHALEYKLAIPGRSIRELFLNKLMPMEKEKCVLMKENAELTSLRDWLLPMLMNGQVKVGGVA